MGILEQAVSRGVCKRRNRREIQNQGIRREIYF